MIETRTQMIKSWAITLAVVTLLIIFVKGTVYNFISQYLGMLGVWLNNYLSIFIILAVSIPLIKYLVSSWVNK